MPDRTRFTTWLGFLVFVFVVGLRSTSMGGAGPTHEVRLRVPFLSQGGDRDCGPTSLLILLRWAGHPGQRRDLVELEISALGVLPVQIEKWLQARGIPYQRLAGRWTELTRVVSRGIPVMVLWNRSQGPLRSFHYVVVVGYRETREGDAVLVHDGREAYRAVSWNRFRTWWMRARYWNLYLTRKTKSEARDPS